MVESSDLQAAILRTQAAERIQQLQSQQEEMNRKRFELEMARQRAEKGKRVQDAQAAEHKRVVRDRYDGEERGEGSDEGRSGTDAGSPGAEDEPRRDDEGDDGPRQGGIDVRV